MLSKNLFRSFPGYSSVDPTMPKFPVSFALISDKIVTGIEIFPSIFHHFPHIFR